MNEFKIDVNGLNWTLYVRDRSHPAFDSENPEEEILGKTSMRDLQVYVDGTLDPVVFRRTVIHELTHVFAYSYAVNLNMADEEVIAEFNGAYIDDIYHLTEEICKERG